MIKPFNIPDIPSKLIPLKPKERQKVIKEALIRSATRSLKRAKELGVVFSKDKVADTSDRDLVDRLRDCQPKGTTGGYLFNDAADEIVKLRQKIATMSEALKYCAEHARPSIVQDVAKEALNGK